MFHVSYIWFLNLLDRKCFYVANLEIMKDPIESEIDGQSNSELFGIALGGLSNVQREQSLKVNVIHLL